MAVFSVFVTRQLPAPLDALQSIAAIEVWPEREPPPYPILQARAKQVDGLITLLTDPIDRPLMQSAPNLKVVSQMAVGYDNIDVAAATEAGIPVGHTPGVLTAATADLTWALLMAAARRVVAGDQFVRQGEWHTWEPNLLLGPDVAGATLGIVGLGRIGQAVARRARGFEMPILYSGRQPVDAAIESSLNATYVSFEKLLQESDFISIHTPLNPETYHLFGEAQFTQMKSSAIVINTARGSIIDPTALYKALSRGQIAGAALDVTDPEPIALESPLLTLENLIITPHIGSASIQARRKMAEMAIANLIAGLKGDPLPHCVNPEVYPLH